MSASPLKKKLDQIAKMINEADALAKSVDPRAYIYFEGSGGVYALIDAGGSDNPMDEECLAKSKSANFDCGGF